MRCPRHRVRRPTSAPLNFPSLPTGREPRLTRQRTGRRHRPVPIHRARMLKSPINRNPPRRPLLQPQTLRPRRVPPHLKQIEILPLQNRPIPFQKRPPQPVRQRRQCLLIIHVIRINRIVLNPRPHKLILVRIVKLRPLKSRRRHPVHPQRLHPRMPDIPRVRRPRHAATLLPCSPAYIRRAAIPRCQKLPLLQREMRQLINLR